MCHSLSLAKRRLWEILSLYNCLEGGCSQVGVGLFSQVTGQEDLASSCARRGPGWTSGGMSSLNRQPREVLESPCLEVFGMVLSAMAWMTRFSHRLYPTISGLFLIDSQLNSFCTASDFNEIAHITPQIDKLTYSLLKGESDMKVHNIVKILTE